MKRAIALVIMTTLGLGSAVASAQDPNAFPPNDNPAAAAGAPAMPAAPPDTTAAPGASSTPTAPPAIEQVPIADAQPAPAEQPTLERFQQVLSPHGRWVATREYGTVWVPNAAANDPAWRPYTNGRWAQTEAGFTFASNDSWGWAPFHYGRWLYYAGLGWSWIPGYRWSPAWVSWRTGGEYVGWAPLGPDGIALSYYDSPSLWLSVRAPYFYRPLMRSYFLSTAYVRSHVWGRTAFAGLPRRGYYNSPSAAYISRVGGVSVYRVSSRGVAPRWVAGGAYRPSALAFRGSVIATPRGGYVGRPSGTSIRGGGYTGYRAPTTGYRAPTTGYRAPATGYRAPTTGYRAPTTGYRAPQNGQRATTPYRGSTTVRPSTTYRPAATNYRPAATNYRPAATNYRPAATNYRPAATNYRPASNYRPSPVRSQAPSAGYRASAPSYPRAQPMQSRAYQAPSGSGQRSHVASTSGYSSSTSRSSSSSKRR